MILLLAAILATIDDGRLALGDLAAYRDALEIKMPDSVPAVTFRDLWAHPDRYQGRPVRVEARVVRRFRRESVGRLPPLAEVWAVEPSGDPLCLVFPDADGSASLAVGRTIRFAGTYLKRVRYRGGDADRLAPLIVGPSPPTPLADSDRRSLDLALGVGAAFAVMLMLSRRALSRPIRRPVPTGPAPEFVDGPAPEALGWNDRP